MDLVERYLRATGLFRDYTNSAQDPEFSEVVELDLASVVPSVSGPKRPHDRVSVTDMAGDFASCISSKVGFKVWRLLSQLYPFMTSLLTGFWNSGRQTWDGSAF